MAAFAAVVLPTLVAYNIPPSATFFNQAAAFVGWGGFLLCLGALLSRDAWPRSSASLAVLAAFALLVVLALASTLFDASPWSLTLSTSGTLLGAALTFVVAGAAARSGLAEDAFRAFCIALVIAGVASSLIGLVQVFAPTLPDGSWVALPALPGRASGSLRQPNHLSSILLWSIVATAWLGETRMLRREVGWALILVFVYVIVLSASRTGALAMLVLAAWGLVDRRLSIGTRRMLMLAPIVYGACWWGMAEWAAASHHLFGGQTRFGGSGDISSSRFGIWSNTLSLIASHPWFGVGFGEFNFAWTLTPFPHRPVAFFDHTHNIVLNFLVEFGVPLGLLVTTLLAFALWKAFENARVDGKDGSPGRAPVRRAAFVIVFMVGVHSMLEYPLWYAYFLLPAVFAFGLCLERPAAAGAVATSPASTRGTRPLVLASMVLMLGGMLAFYDYSRVAVIFSPGPGAGPLAERIAEGRRSVLFAHHADYAAATVAAHPGKVMSA
ncbi:MAG: Wzy polymerase domain-containing protein, partial [Caldimonas sp.]